MLSIEKIAYALPVTLLDVINDYQKIGVTAAQAKVYHRLYGLQDIPTIVDHTELIDLFKYLGNSILAEEDNDLIKYIIHVHTGALISTFGNSLVNNIKMHCGLENAIAFGTSFNKCSSLFSALEIAQNLLIGCKKRSRILIISGEVAFNRDLKVVNGTTIIGDAVGALVVSLNKSSNNIIALNQMLDGNFARGIWLSSVEIRNLEDITAKKVTTVVQQALSEANISLDDIKYVLPHNINIQGWHKLALNVGIDINKVYLRMVSKTAHCFCSDFMINFVNIKNDMNLETDDYLLMISIGVGSIFSAAI
ncbi:MAG: hypothetical protein E6Q89_04825 [Bacteroidia bacterium]|nr:MAG: hypothetical protein E6Q89_04825 [Bacteroidia bacterium]